MSLSVSELSSGRVPDVCIIGSGSAGMTLAVELHRVGKDVLVLEGGGGERTGESQDIYRGQTEGNGAEVRAGEGIVNADLRVWGQDNLYVAGSSVFPSGGQATTTFTIVQLSLRLANHLSRRL
ncbi:MAG: GMC oxidoreductase [Pirellulaceae bacterium]